MPAPLKNYMEKENSKDLTVAEAEFVVNMMAKASVNHLSPDAPEICVLMQSIVGKLGSLIERGKPLASAARPKLVGDAGADLLEIDAPENAQTANA